MATTTISVSIDDEMKQDAQKILSELDKSMQEATDPNTKWLSHEEMVNRMDNRRKVRNSV